MEKDFLSGQVVYIVTMWLAYAPEELLLNSLYPKAAHEQYFAKKEQNYKNTLGILADNKRVIIPILKDSYIVAKSLNYQGFTSLNDYEEDATWINVYFKGTRYGYSFLKGCWTEKSTELELISPLVTICINK